MVTISIGDENFSLVRHLFQANYKLLYCGRFQAAEMNIEQLRDYLTNQYQLPTENLETIEMFYQHWLSVWETDHDFCTYNNELIEIREEENPKLPVGYPNFRAITG